MQKPIIKQAFLHKCESCNKQASSALVVFDDGEVAFAICEYCLPHHPMAPLVHDCILMDCANYGH